MEERRTTKEPNLLEEEMEERQIAKAQKEFEGDEPTPEMNEASKRVIGAAIELKSVYMILPVHRAQLHAYLKATGHRLGLLFNFDASILQIRRVIESQNP